MFLVEKLVNIFSQIYQISTKNLKLHQKCKQSLYLYIKVYLNSISDSINVAEDDSTFYCTLKNEKNEGQSLQTDGQTSTLRSIQKSSN